MDLDKSLISGSIPLLVMKLLEDGDLYGYQMIEELRRRSDDTFHLKAGTLYPLLHGLEEKGWITSYQGEGGGRTRKYYHLTEKGRRELKEKRAEWDRYTRLDHLIAVPVSLLQQPEEQHRCAPGHPSFINAHG